MADKADSNRVASTEAAKNFGALVDRVRETGAVYQIESRGQVVAEIGPAMRPFTLGDLRALLARQARVPADLLDAIEAGRREAREVATRAVPALSGRGGRPRRPGRRSR